MRTQSNAVRADLEDRARGPFAVDAETVLEILSETYGDDYTLGHDGRWFWAHRDECEEAVTAATPDELVAAIRARWPS